MVDRLVFAEEAMTVSRFVLATPPVTALSLAAVSSVDRGVRDAARAQGTRVDTTLVVVKRARYGTATAVLAGLGRAVSEAGLVLVVNAAVVRLFGRGVGS